MTTPKPPKIKIENWPIDRLKPYEKNPRHNDAHVERMAALFSEYGWRGNPIIAKSDGEIIAGHLRLKAALALGYKTVPVSTADDLTPAQIKAFRIAENKASEWAGWDEELLRIEVEELQELEYDLGFTGISDAELKELLSDGDIDPDDVPEQSYVEQYGVIVICENAEHQEKVYEKLNAGGYNCRVVVT